MKNDTTVVRIRSSYHLGDAKNVEKGHLCNKMSRSPVKIHVTPNQVAPAPALTSSVDYKSELFLVFLPLFPSINKLVLQLVAEDGWHLKVLATVAAMGPTKLVLAVVAAVVVVVVTAIVAAVFQRHVVPGAIPYGLNVHVGGTEPRVLDGRCSVSIQEWFFEVALVSRNIFLSFKSVYAFRDRFGFVNGLKQMQVGLLTMNQTGTFDDYIHAFSSSSSQVKYLHDRTRALLFTSGFASDL